MIDTISLVLNSHPITVFAFNFEISIKIYQNSKICNLNEDQQCHKVDAHDTVDPFLKLFLSSYGQTLLLFQSSHLYCLHVHRSICHTRIFLYF